MGGHFTELGMWLTLIGSAGAMLWPDLVLAQGLFAESLIDRGAVRMIAFPLFVAMAVLLTDFYWGWAGSLLK